MGLNVLAFIAAAGLLAILAVVARHGRHTAASRFQMAIDGFLALFAIFQGLSLIASSNTAAPEQFVLYSRTASACLVAAQFLFVCFAMSFPRWFVRWIRFLTPVIFAGAAYVIYFIFFNPDYITGTKFGAIGLALQPGPAFEWVNLVSAGVGALAALTHLLRGIQTDSSINRERSIIAFIGLLFGVSTIWAYQRYSVYNPTEVWPYVATPLIALAMSGIVAYAASISRLFDWRELGSTVLAYSALTVVVGVPTAGVVILLAMAKTSSALIPIIGSFFVFLIAGAAARGFSRRFFERIGTRHEYREMLESALAHIDLSAGRDAVLADLQGLLTENLGFTDFTILIEDDRGTLKTAHSPTGGHASLDRNNPIRLLVEAQKVNVLMLSEAQADSAYESVETELLALFASLRAEVLIFARESGRVIGVFAIGSRKIGGEYTDYDYDTFKALCGKLFVFAFYLKNVARESILYTVDRELALSDQIIRFALEHVSPVEHPKADAAWSMRSTRRLGGDFVDFVRMGKERWFFVLGDVSGKGLSASMNMLILKSMIRTFLRIEKDFAGLVQRVNAFIKDNLPKGSFFAGVFGYFDFEKNTLYFINCGVPAILLYSPNFDAFIEVQGEGKVLGFVRDVSPYLKPRKLSLNPGTAIVVSTDGLLDSENIRGERFGKERLRKASRERLDKPARAIADGVIEDLLRFTDNKQEDDITLLIMKIR